MWNRWFCVEQVEAFVVGTTVFPKRQAKNLANILARWSTQRLSKDVHMKLLEVDDEEGTEEDDDDIEDFSLSNATFPAVVGVAMDVPDIAATVVRGSPPPG